MAPQLPDRYVPNIRLGSDEDLEEWLATDTVLDRPVLVRLLSPGTAEHRRRRFVDAIRAIAAVPHVHLTGVYAVGEAGDGAYAVMEWNGGVSLSDRIDAGETLPVDEFLPNAAGLADALATLHDAGVVHGAIDLGAITFAAAHPAKLSGYGRRLRWDDRRTDVEHLAGVLRAALTGDPTSRMRPSQVAEGLPAAVDEVLDRAERGEMSAAELSAALLAIPYRPPQATDPWSWRWLIPAGLLLAVALLISAAGLAIDVSPDSPFLFPATPGGSTSSTTTAQDPGITVPSGVLPAQADVFDPLGDGTERDGDLINLLDGDTATAWRTEAYFDPLPQVKAGVGVIFTVDGLPNTMEIRGSPTARFEIRWSSEPVERPEDWERVASGSLLAGGARIQLPVRDGGAWLLWFTDVPEQEDGRYYAAVSDVRFLP